MADTILKGYVDIWGKHGAVVSDHTGPALYTTGGETIGVNSLVGVNRYGLRSYDFVDSMGLSVSGNYYMRTQPTGIGSRTTFKAIWFYSEINTLGQTANTQVAANTNLSGETIRLLLIGA